MSRRGLAVWVMAAAVTGLVFGAPAAAQAPGAGTIEIGAFGQWTSFDENAGRPNVVPEDGFGYGGRLGFFFTQRLQLEADGWYSPQDRDPDETFCCTGAQPTEINASGLALRLNYNLPIASLMQLVIGAGGVRTNYAFAGGTGADSAITSWGASGLAGLRFVLASPLALRVDGVADYMPSHEPEANLNLHARAGLSLLLGGGRPAPLPVPLPPPPPPPFVAPPPPPPPPPVMPTTISVCVVENGMLRNAQAQYAAATGDTTVAGRPFAQAYPATAPSYAGGSDWYIQGGPLTLDGRRFVKFGLPRVLGVNDVARMGEYQGTPVFAEPGMARPDVVYVAVRPGCEFQPYQAEVKAGSVRG